MLSTTISKETYKTSPKLQENGNFLLIGREDWPTGVQSYIPHLINRHNYNHDSKTLYDISEMSPSLLTVSSSSLRPSQRFTTQAGAEKCQESNHRPLVQISGTNCPGISTQIPTKAKHTRFLTVVSSQPQPSCLLLKAESGSSRGRTLHPHCFTEQALVRDKTLACGREYLQSQDSYPHVHPLPQALHPVLMNHCGI